MSPALSELLQVIGDDTRNRLRRMDFRPLGGSHAHEPPDPRVPILGQFLREPLGGVPRSAADMVVVGHVREHAPGCA